MFNPDQSKRIAHRATVALVKAIDAFPKMLENAEAEALGVLDFRVVAGKADAEFRALALRAGCCGV